MEKDPEKQEDRERKTETKKLASYDGFPVLLRQYGAPETGPEKWRERSRETGRQVKKERR
jgi:hypothetical protein